MQIIIKKYHTIIIITLIVLADVVQTADGKDSPASAEQLRSALETAINAKDTNTVLALVDWQGLSPEMIAETTEEMDELAGAEATNVTLLPLPADYQATNELNGVRYFPNVRLLGLINVESPQPGNSTQIPYGESNGLFFIAGTLQQTIDPHPTKAVSLGVMIMGRFPNESPGILKCSYVYVADGREQQGGFQCTNNMSSGFWGDYIKSCTLTKVSGAGSYKLSINAAGKAVYDSGWMETNAAIIYEKK